MGLYRRCDFSFSAHLNPGYMHNIKPTAVGQKFPFSFLTPQTHETPELLLVQNLV